MGPAVLRLAMAAVFIGHGAQKLFGLWGGGGLAGTADYFASVGLPQATLLAMVFGVVELTGGVLLLAGAYTRWIAPLLAIDLATLAWKAALFNGFLLDWNQTPGVGRGVEYPFVLVAGLVCLTFTGAGALSVDAYRRRSADAAAAGRARVRAGKV